ncbi:DUF3969 family protein [Candidatus Galacturonibacter soehngenii]|uniref:DUF3969 family protein n=1 Tax=Candidatus Galacturonatibacter soehngenii TaxID=2307010 RepID=A0A7V7UBR9_9FIRM|nr:DUF3969 family protein [Candidatus Galacturonibacter soehngenii]KAB1438060.1 DUF3969 family protein [Candidatus Galacturonibacter soehngenii]
MKIENICFKTNEVDTKILLINIIGVLVAIKEKKMSIEEAEKFIFSPYFIQKVKESCDEEQLIDILERGCEIEDIESLLPDRLEYNVQILIDKTLNLLGLLEKKEEDFWI